MSILFLANGCLIHLLFHVSLALPQRAAATALTLSHLHRAIAPHMQHEQEAAVPSDLDPNPLEYKPLPRGRETYHMVNGVVQVWADEGCTQNLFPVPGTAADFFTDMHRVLRYASLGPVKSFCHHRLMLLEQKFNLHVMLNADKEFLAQKSAPHRDFYNVRKVGAHAAGTGMLMMLARHTFTLSWAAQQAVPILLCCGNVLLLS